MASDWDTVRLPAGVVRQLAAQSPTALAVLCRVLHRCRHEPRKCWASVETLSEDGAKLSLPAVRAALLLLQAGRLLHGEDRARSTTIYSPTENLPRKPQESVFLPMEAWFTLDPRTLAFYAMRIALGRGVAARCAVSAPDVGKLVRGARGPVSRATAYRMQAQLLRLGLLDHRPVSKRGPSLKTTAAKSQSDLRFVSPAAGEYGREKLSEQIPPEDAWGRQLSTRPPIEAAAQWAGVKFRADKEPAVKEPSAKPEAPVQLVKQFAELRKLAGSALGLAYAAKTQTGLPQIKETKLAHQWCELTEEARADLPLLGAYIAAGGFTGLRVPAWAWIADRLLESLCRAREWHNAGRPSLLRLQQIKTVQEEESLYDTWNAVRPRAAKGGMS